MYFINPHIPAYYFNRKKQTEPVDGKFTYCYPNGNRIEKYEVSPEIYKALKKRDKKEYLNDRRQYRHHTNFPTYYNDYEDIEDDAEYDPWWNYPDKKSYTNEGEICERLDREAVIANRSETDKAIYHHILERDYSQEDTAELLGIDQATVSRKLKEIKGVLKRQFLTDGTNTKTDIDFYIAWEELCATGKTKNGDDVILEYIFQTLTPKDLQLFLYWFYSLKELVRYALKYLITREAFVDEDIQNFVSKASLKGKEHLEKYYGNQPPLLQCVYVNMLLEVWRRVKMFPGVPLGTNYYKADIVLAKIAKRLKTTEDEFLCKRFFPFLSKARLKRYKEFLKKYKH